MIAFLNILKINAQYELKILLKSWFFRIFAVTSILFLIGFDVLFYSSITPVPRFFRGLDSFLPYFNTLTPHFVLVIVLAFLATDLYKRDRKFNTTDIIYIRDMSNFAFIMGRTLGVLLLFFILDVIFLIVAAIINIFFSDQNFIWQAYLIYLFLLVLPSSVFVMGFTYFLIHLLRNQAVVILLVLGFLGGSIFYLSDYGFMVFDIMAVKLPFAYSDFIGISNDAMILYQRFGWLLSGIFFLLLSVLLAKRLPQSRRATAFIRLTVIVLPVAISALFYSYYQYFNEGESIRKLTLQQSEFITKQNNPYLSKYNLEVKHFGDNLEISSKLHFRNNTDKTIDTLYVLLNKGLKITTIKQDAVNLTFQENGNLRKINLKNVLLPGKKDSIQIEYNGYIDDRIANSEIKNADHISTHFIWLFRMEARHSFVKDNYVVLPPALYWYPKNIPSSTRDLLKPFVDFSLRVETKNDLLAISQGQINNYESGGFIFENNQSLKEISLIIGPYTAQTVKSDSIEFNLYSLAKHDYYKTYFKEIGDTLHSVLNELMEDFENKTDLIYPFKRLNLIEVPAHMYSYQQNGRENADFVQAEQIWIPENAASLTASYFKFSQERQKRRGNRGNQTFTDLEKEILMFERFARDTFTGGGGFPVGGDGEIISFVPNLNIYPLFLNLAVSIDNSKNNGFAIALEANLKNEAEKKEQNRWSIGELTDDEKANLALTDTSFLAIEQNAEKSLVNKVWLAKGSFLLKQIKQSLGDDNFKIFMQNLIRNNLFKQISMFTIIDDLKNNYNFNLEKSLDGWINDDRLPGFQFSSLKSYQMRDGERLRYQVLFDVKNPTETDGLFEVDFKYPGENRRRFAMSENETSPKWLFKANAGTLQQVGIILDSEPRSIRINTLISQNLPSIYSFVFQDIELEPNKKAIEGIFAIDRDAYKDEEDVLIVDNTNESFGYVHPRYRSKLKAWIHEDSEKDEAEFKRFSWWRGPTQWQKLKFPSLYGEFVHSAYYARTGKGERKATWLTEIPVDGNYQIFVHVPDQGDFRMGRHSREQFGIQKYTVDHADGQDEIEMDFSEADPGWNYLETYFFEEGNAKIELSDDSGGRMVIADAVKWELKE